MKKKMIILILAVCAAMGMTGCRSSEKNVDDQKKEENLQGTVTLAAAASLEYAFEEELIPKFEKKYPEVSIEGVYDSSGKLQQQIESGLAADIFFSAAPAQMNALDEEGLIDHNTIENLLENKIVLIVPDAAEKNFTSFEDITKADTVAVGDPESVPAGQYAKEALTNLGIWETVSEKASFGTNVTEVLNWVAESSADCGIVYATDAATTDQVKVVSEAPESSLKSPVLYPVALTQEASEKDAAKAFFEFILSDDAMKVFESYGFTDYRNAE